MKPYITQLSIRPGCPCCPASKHMHGHIKNKTESVKRARRAGKKSMRQKLKREMRNDT